MVYNVLKFKSYLENLEINDYRDHKKKRHLVKKNIKTRFYLLMTKLKWF